MIRMIRLILRTPPTNRAIPRREKPERRLPAGADKRYGAWELAAAPELAGVAASLAAAVLMRMP